MYMRLAYPVKNIGMCIWSWFMFPRYLSAIKGLVLFKCFSLSLYLSLSPIANACFKGCPPKEGFHGSDEGNLP